MGELMSLPKARRFAPRNPWKLFSIWFALVSMGFAGLGAYGVSAGESGPVPGTWPADISRADGSTLLCFVHPKCPCSQATWTELRKVMSDLSPEVNVELVVFQPEGVQPEGGTSIWGDRLWNRMVSPVPGAQRPRWDIRLDPGGVLAKRFGAATSGMILVYGPRGQLQFQGGITASRGHIGQSPAQDWLRGAIAAPGVQRSSAPVFGCPIF